MRDLDRLARPAVPAPVRAPDARAARVARTADVVYASATYAAAAAASLLSRRPLVVKLVSDPAYERARRWRLFGGTLEQFQAGGSPLVRRSSGRERCAAPGATCDRSQPLSRGVGDRLGSRPRTGRRRPEPGARRSRSTSAPERRGLVFAGRLTRQKALDTALDAIARVPEANLLVIGDGPDRARLERHAAELGLNGRVRFVGSVPRAEVLQAFAAAEALVISSDWENFPHAAVEALALGTPLIATAVGGVPEIVVDGVNGLLVPPGHPGALAAAIERFLGSAELRASLSGAARGSVEHLSAPLVYGRIEELLAEAGAR